MFQVPINYLAILVCGIVSMVIGYLWYGPLFGKVWMGLMGMRMENMTEEKKKGMAKSYFMMFVGSLFMAYVLSFNLIFAATYLKMTGLSAGAVCAFWNWLGFIAPVTLGSVLWEGKSWKLWLLNNGYQLVTLVVMGTILMAWR
ncbi:MAG TPA: DUF1761 domain-containing protein [Candidatus Udaeobacter sp.]|nr:DUF1761 domain-containing protein [Candidatus Udaeobacter sp.]